MTISNFGDNYIKIHSDAIQEVIDNPSSYSSMQISANINCCTNNCNDLISTATILLPSGAGWQLDLSTAVGLDETIRQLYLQNIITGKKFQVLTTSIALSYVSTNCAANASCTLQTFSSHFAPLFKSQIDTWFSSQSISSNVTITFSGNTLIVSNLPVNFIGFSGKYGATSDVYVEALFGSSTISTRAFLGSDGLYIKPGMFSSNVFRDGIYSLTVKSIKASGGFVEENNCAFIDITTKCRVAATLNRIKEEADLKEEQVSTLIHILHYALVNGSNCICNCVELCKVYAELQDLIKNIDPQITNCGC
jgi:hypothetical protein